MSEETNQPPVDRRGGRRRTYNRRRDDSDVGPPYFEVFERIALSLEHIEEMLRARTVTLPDAGSKMPSDR